MTLMNKWLIPVALLGTTALMVGVTLFWLVLTQPVAVAQVLGRAF